MEEAAEPDCGSCACVEGRHQHPAAAACESIFDGPFSKQRRKELQTKLQSSVACTNVVGALQHILITAVLSAEKHRRLSLRWSRLHYVLGLPAAIATSVGALALSSDGAIGDLAAYIVLGSGILAASLTFLRCAELRDRNSALCAGWTALADCVRVTLFSVQEDNESGDEPAAIKRRYRKYLIELNHEKMQLLWGVLTAGPARQDPSVNRQRVGAHNAGPARDFAATNGELRMGQLPSSSLPA